MRIPHRICFILFLWEVRVCVSLCHNISDFLPEILGCSLYRYLLLSHCRQQQDMECVQDVRVAILVYCIVKAHSLARSQCWMTKMDRDGEV